jgi:hypothetical protein
MSTPEVVANIAAELEARDRRIERLDALLKGQQDANRQLRDDILRLGAEVDASEWAFELAKGHADSLI